MASNGKSVPEPVGEATMKKFQADGDALPLVALVVIALFAWLPDSYFLMVSWPWVLGWQLGFLLVAIAALIRLRCLGRPFYRLGHGLDWVILALYLSLWLSGGMSAFPSQAIQNIVLASCYLSVLYGLANSSLATPRRLWMSLVAIGGIASLVSLLLWQPTPEMWLSNDFYSALRNRFPLGHHNFSGGYFVLVLPLAVTAALAQRGWRRWLLGAASLTIGVALYGTGSRGAWLGAMAMLAVSLAYWLVTSRGQARRRALLASLASMLLVVGLMFSNPRVRSFLTVAPQAAENGGATVIVADGPARDRFFMAKAALNILRDRPLVGVGPGNMGYVYNLYRPIETSRGLEHVQQLHNTPVHIAGELGLLGLGLYGLLLGILIRLWWRGFQGAQTGENRLLAGGIAVAGLGYAVSSLTDYQLENIPIAGTLAIAVILLVRLGGQPPAVSSPLRRVISLLLLGLLALALQLWLRNDLAFWFTHRGRQALMQSDFIQADSRFTRAAEIAPWNPTPSALAAGEIQAALETLPPDQQQPLKELVVDYYRRALLAAPNDVWFHNNLAYAHIALDQLEPALDHAQTTVQLLPRNPGYTYYILGLLYLSQNRIDEAVTAFSLEALINPQTVSMSVWQTPPLSNIREEFLAATVDLYTRLYEQTPEDAIARNLIYEQLQLIRWWAGEDLGQINHSRLRPTVRAVLIADSDPETAIEIAQGCLAQDAAHAGCQLLQVWLQPERHLADYLNRSDLARAEQARARDHILSQRQVLGWLTSAHVKPQFIRRGSLALAYRSRYANAIEAVSQPRELQVSAAALTLELFQKMPWELASLDYLIETVRTQQLGLPHPTRTGYELVKTEP